MPIGSWCEVQYSHRIGPVRYLQQSSRHHDIGPQRARGYVKCGATAVRERGSMRAQAERVGQGS